MTTLKINDTQFRVFFNKYTKKFKAMHLRKKKKWNVSLKLPFLHSEMIDYWYVLDYCEGDSGGGWMRDYEWDSYSEVISYCNDIARRDSSENTYVEMETPPLH